MRCATLTLVVAGVCTLAACKEKPPAPTPAPPPPPPRDGVTLIQPGAPPHQALRYQLIKGEKTQSQLVWDLDIKNDGQGSPMPVLVVDLETSVEDVLADGSARLRVTVIRTTVRERPGSPVTSDLVLAQAAAMQGVAITQALAPDGTLSDARVEAPATVPDAARTQLDSLMRSLQHMAVRMPTEPVGVGATWRERRTLPEGGIRAVSETTYTLTALAGGAIRYTSTGHSTGEPQTIAKDGMTVEVTGTRGHSQATGSVDLARYAFELTATSTFATAMNVVAPKDTPGAGPSTIEITTAIQVTPAGTAEVAPSATTHAAPSGARVTDHPASPEPAAQSQ